MDNSRPPSEQGTPGDPATEVAVLIARLETATGPDRELDIEIGTAVGGADHSGPASHRPFREWAKHYTASIDAALTLVPEPNVIGDKGRRIELSYVERSFTAAAQVNHDHHGYGKTPAIALCIAAMKARAATSDLGSPAANSPSNEADVVPNTSTAAPGGG